MTARFSMLLESRASLTCFRACFLPGRAKDLSAPRYNNTELARNIFYSESESANKEINGVRQMEFGVDVDYVQGVSGVIINSLGGGSMDYSE